MLVRDTTDYSSPLAIERHPAGFRMPMLTTAAGRVYLAFSPAAEREHVLEILSHSTREEDKLARNRPEVDKILDETRSQGYATATRPRRVAEQIAMSVPIMHEDRMLAAVAVRFSANAVPMRTAVERFLPRLRDTAQKITLKFNEQHVNPPFRREAATAR
jgi:IclR family mhp operon transcriptional activator